jgi:hypothetical protein
MASAIQSLDGSLTQALAKHPRMKRFVACLPFDLSDSRKEGVKTALGRWDEWTQKRINDAAAAGRPIEIERWDAHELKVRLTGSNPLSSGRIAFWFDRTLLTSEWLRKEFERTRISLGKRYSQKATSICLFVGCCAR